MFTVRTILATTAIAALTAFPVTALTLDAAADVQLNAMTDVEAIASTETAVATNDAAKVIHRIPVILWRISHDIGCTRC